MRVPTRLAAIAGLAVVVAGGAYLLYPGAEKGTSPAVATEIVFQLPWRHSGAFAGYYLADQTGVYQETGIEISFREGGGPVDPIVSVVEGMADIGIATGNHILEARAAGKPVVAIAAVHQINPIVFAALESSGIRHPRDFAGKVIRSSRTNLPILRAIAKRFGVEPDDYEIVDIHNTTEVYERLYRGEIDVLTGFHFWTPNKFSKDGKKANYIYPDNYGIHFYRDCIFTTEDFITKHPEVVENFLRATLLRGWPEAFRDPSRAGAMTLEYRPESDPAFETAFLTAMIPLINDGNAPIGWMRTETWRQMTEILKNIDFLPATFDSQEAYTMSFLRKIYPDAEVN